MELITNGLWEKDIIVRRTTEWKQDWLIEQDSIALGKTESGKIVLICKYYDDTCSLDNDFEGEQQLIDYYNTGDFEDED